MWCCAVYRFRRRYTALERRRLGAADCAIDETNALIRVAASYSRCTKTRVKWLIERLLKIFFFLFMLFLRKTKCRYVCMYILGNDWKGLERIGKKEKQNRNLVTYKALVVNKWCDRTGPYF